MRDSTENNEIERVGDYEGRVREKERESGSQIV